MPVLPLTVSRRPPSEPGVCVSAYRALHVSCLLVSCCWRLQAWRESGLAAPADIDALNQKISQLEQQIIDLRLQLEEQGEDLTAARAANRELMAQLNTTAKHQ